MFNMETIPTTEFRQGIHRQLHTWLYQYGSKCYRKNPGSCL